MRNNIDILNFIKRVFLSLIFILSTATYAATYYVDATGGDDSNNGLTEGNAWKSLNKVASSSYNPGDQILFKRGETFVAKSAFIFNGSSGTESSPIVISSYGTGDKPIITPLKEQTLSWSYQGNNIWRTSVTNNPKRLFRDNIELLIAEDASEMDGSKYHWYWSSGYLYIEMSDSPANHKIEFSTISNAFKITSEEYINISDIEFQSGYSYSVYVVNSSYITFNNCNIGKYSNQGIQLAGSSGSHHSVVEYCVVNSHYEFTYTGSPKRGAREGILMQGPSTYNHIRYNTIKNWAHANINMYQCSYNKVYGNYSSAPGISTGGRLSLDGSTCHHNEVYNNTFKDQHAQNQLNGHDNHIHHNVFDGNKDAPAGSSFYGKGITMQAYNSHVYGNIIEYNIIRNTDREAIAFSANNSGGDLHDITIRYNIMDNVGLVKASGIAIKLGTGGSGLDAYNLKIYGNNIYNPGETTTINYYNSEISVAIFNGKSQAWDNTAHIDVQEIGGIPVTAIGAPASIITAATENPDTITEDPIILSGPFIITPEGLH